MLDSVYLLLGAILLLAGRKLFWLFIAIVGFVTGIHLAASFITGPEWIGIVIGVVAGILFAILSVLIEALAIGAAGFLVGGYILTTLTNILGLNEGLLYWLFFAIGGVIGILLVMFLFDWALITLSSLAGASLIVQSLFPQASGGGVLFMILFVAGIFIQGLVLQREDDPPVRRYRRKRRVKNDND